MKVVENFKTVFTAGRQSWFSAPPPPLPGILGVPKVLQERLKQKLPDRYECCFWFLHREEPEEELGTFHVSIVAE